MKPRRPAPGLEPSKFEYVHLANGGAIVRLPNGVERVYDEEELADYVIELIHRAHVEPHTVDERWLETIKLAVGKERWDQACQIVGAIIAP